VLSYVLNTDPCIFGGGELRRLVDADVEVECDACGPDCTCWTPDNLRLFRNGGRDEPPRLFYATLARITGAAIIADSSKWQSFFSDSFIAAQESECGAEFAFVLCVKHPVRLYASYIYNELVCGTGRRVSSYAELMELMEGDLGREARWRFLPHVANRLYEIYRHLHDRFVDNPDRPCLVLKHEQLAAPDGAADLADFVERALGYRPALDVQNYAAYEAHTTGGNRAPVWQSALARDPEFSVDDARFRYYRRHPGVQLDQKYRRLMSPDLVRRVLDWEITEELCTLLGYSCGETRSVLVEAEGDGSGDEPWPPAGGDQ
jgi:hypothetical protein